MKMLRKSIFPFFLAALLLILLFTANLTFTRMNNAGVDFLIRWLPTRMLLFEGLQSPYAEEATAAVELYQYGHRATGTEVEGLFLYPYYTIFFLLPFALLKEYTIARALWMTLLEVSHISIIYLSFLSLQVKPGKINFFLLVLLGLMSTYFFQPIVDGNPASVAGLLLVLCLYFLSKEKDALAGFFLAMATLKPQLTFIFFGLAWWWAISHKRWQVIMGSLVGMAVLMGLSFALHPAWLSEFYQQVTLYPDIATPNTPATILAQYLPGASRFIAAIIALLSGGLLLFEWIRLYGKDFRHFYWTACLSFALLPFTGMVFGNRNLIMLLPGMVLLTAIMIRRFSARAWLWNLALIGFVSASWLILFLPLFLLKAPAFINFNFYLPLPFLMSLSLYVVRRNWLDRPLETGGVES